MANAWSSVRHGGVVEAADVVVDWVAVGGTVVVELAVVEVGVVEAAHDPTKIAGNNISQAWVRRDITQRIVAMSLAGEANHRESGPALKADPGETVGG